MLVLTVKRGSGLVIFTPEGKRIDVRVMGLGPKSVKFGVVAPADVRVIRSEIEHRDMHGGSTKQ